MPSKCQTNVSAKSAGAKAHGQVLKPSDSDLQEFQNLLDWCTGSPLPDGRYLGWAGDAPQDGHHKWPPGLDHRVKAVVDRVQTANKTVLELGSCEGVLTVQLARLFRKVVAIEVRPKNIVCSLVRLFVHEIRNCDLHLMDARDLDDSIGRFDVLFHSGLLYHLRNPVEHLIKVRNIADTLFLDTHYGDDRPFLSPDTIRYGGVKYDCYRYGEHGWDDALSGVEESSSWLSRESLFKLLAHAGFGEVEVVSEIETRSGMRIGIFARRKRLLSRVFDRFRG